MCRGPRPGRPAAALESFGGTRLANVHAVISPNSRSAAKVPSGLLTSAAALVVIIAGLKYAQEMLVPVLLGVMIAAASSQLVTRLLRRGLPPIAVAGIVLLLDIAALASLGALVVVAAGDLQTLLPKYVAQLASLNDVVRVYLGNHGLARVEVPAIVGVSQLSSALGGLADQLASMVSYATVVLLVAFFTLCEVTVLGDKVRSLSHNADEQFARFNRIVHEIQRYLLVKTLTSLLVGGLAFVLLKSMGVGLALLLALSFFLLHFIPNVGAIIATVPAVLITLADKGVGAAMIVAAAYIVIATVVGSVLEPRMLGKTLGFSPLVVLFGMLFWGWVWGPMGALLSVPLMVLAKIILENIPHLAWIGRLAETPADLSAVPSRVSIPMLRRPSYIIGIGKNPNA